MIRRLFVLILLLTLPAFSQTKVKNLPAASSVGPSDLFYVVAGGTADKKATAATVAESLTGHKMIASYASLSAAVSSISTAQATIVIPATTTVSASLTVPSNITLLPSGPGMISVSSGQTLTIQSSTEGWPARQVFTGNGSVVLSGPGKVLPQFFGDVGKGIQVTDGAMTISTSTLTSATAGFTSSMVGWLVDVNQSGSSVAGIDGVSSYNNQTGTITAVTNSTTATVSFTAGRTVSGATVTLTPDDTAPILKARFAAAGRSLHFPKGIYGVTAAAALSSNSKITGDGKGVTVLQQMGVQRGSSTGFSVFTIADGVQNVEISNLTIRGTNLTGAQVTNVAHYAFGCRIAGGSTADIKDITFNNVEIAYIYGMGIRSDGDREQLGFAPSVIGIKVLNSNLHHISDNCININSSGGMTIDNTYLTDSGNAVEFAGSHFKLLNSFVQRNRGGVSIGGLGNPSFGTDFHISHTTIEDTGISGSGASGLQIGGNLRHVVVDFCTISKSAYQGVGISDGTPDFATLSRDITLAHNRIFSNGIPASGPGIGVAVDIEGTVLESNEVYNDAAITGYSQGTGIQVSADNVKILRDRSHDNASNDYTITKAVNVLLVRENNEGTLSQFEGNGYSGTVDTSGTTVTYKTGDLFSANLVGVLFKANGVAYTVSAVAAKPAGNFTVSGLTVTRTSGTNFDTAWVGQYIRLGASLYFPIASVADASHLIITNPIGNTVPASGAWELYNSVSLTLTASAGTQSAVDYVVPPHVIFPNMKVNSLLFADGTSQSTATAGGGGTGDVVGPSSSVDSEIALFNSTTGKLIKRASVTGILKGTSGVLSAATAGTDYTSPTSTEAFQNKTFANSNNTLGSVTVDVTGTDATGDIWYRNASGVLTRLAIGSTGDVLIVASGLPSWAAPSGGGGGLTIGTTTITSGTNTKVLFNNSGVVGEYTITGTGNVVMSASPTFSGTITAAAATFLGDIKYQNPSDPGNDYVKISSTAPGGNGRIDVYNRIASTLTIFGDGIASNGTLQLGSNNDWRWQVNNSLLPWADNSYNIGSSSLRVHQFFLAEFWEGDEMSDPSAPASNKGRLYFRDNGSGKTQLVVRFPTGAIQVIATEP